MKFNAKELWNSGEETSKLVKVATLYSEETKFADTYFENYVDENDYDEPIEEILDDIRLDYIQECIERFKNSSFYNPSEWDTDEETWLGNEQHFEELLNRIRVEA